MSERPHNPSLDSQLRDVPLPSGLLERLRAVIVSDEALDAELQQVAVPVELVERVLDGVLDEALRATPPPADDAPVRLRRTPQRARAAGAPWRRLGRWAAAASLLLVLMGAHWGAIVGLLASLQFEARPKTELLVLDTGPLQLEGELLEAAVLVRLESPFPPEAPRPADDGIELADLNEPLSGEYGQLVAQLRRGLNLGQDMLVARIEYLGFPVRRPETPARLDEVLPPIPAGAEVPLHRGYDRGFQWRFGVTPWVTPAHDELRRSEVPLASDAAQFDQLRQQLLAGRMPHVGQVRVEDLVAALDYRYPLPADGELDLLTAGGPSVFGEPGGGLLQVGVQAGAPRGRITTPLHLTVVLDVSQSMSAARLDEVCRALFRQLRLLSPDDRMTVVTLGDRPHVLCEGVPTDHLEALAGVLSRLQPRGLADWGQALPRALHASSGAKAARQELVVLSSGRGEWTAQSEPMMRDMLSAALADGMTARVVACQSWKSGHGRLQQWAEQQGMQWVETSRQAVDGALCQAITGRAAVLAEGVKLVLDFNPEAVAAYRILGHDASAGQWTAASEPWQLRPGQQATVMTEIRWRPSSTDDVAWAELSWRDSNGRARRLRRRISRLQFASSFQQSAPSLQEAMLAAEAAQILAQSPFARGRAHTLQRVLNQAQEAGERAAERADFQQLLGLLEVAKRLPPRRVSEEN